MRKTTLHQANKPFLQWEMIELDVNNAQYEQKIVEQ